jgi:phosphatidylserine/phosphatidylglycerophosphate/cardiolipin synthase-like enzyme
MMWLLLATGFTGALTLVFLLRQAAHQLGGISSVEAYFSPKGGCQDAVVRELKAARREVLVQAYSFTAEAITLALVEAKKRGVHVDILLDRSNEQESYSDLHLMLEKGLAPLIDARHAIAHNKVMIIDQRTLVTGSFNFTHQAEHENAENLVVIKGHTSLVKQYRQNFLSHKSHSQTPTLKASHPTPRPAAAHAA